MTILGFYLHFSFETDMYLPKQKKTHEQELSFHILMEKQALKKNITAIALLQFEKINFFDKKKKLHLT